jgi:hypothetical protein
MHWPHFTPQKHYFSVSGTHFCYGLNDPRTLQPEGLGKLKNFTSFGLEPMAFQPEGCAYEF